MPRHRYHQLTQLANSKLLYRTVGSNRPQQKKKPGRQRSIPKTKHVYHPFGARCITQQLFHRVCPRFRSPIGSSCQLPLLFYQTIFRKHISCVDEFRDEIMDLVNQLVNPQSTTIPNMELNTEFNMETNSRRLLAV